MHKSLVFFGLLVFLILCATSCGYHPPTINNQNRTLTVPIHPKRVVVLDIELLQDALALGITPVGASKRSEFWDVLQLDHNQWQSIKETGDGSLPNLEKILSLKPDLILGYKDQKEVYPLLSQIAPTVLIDHTWKNDNWNWEKRFYLVAQALGKKEKAIQVMADYHNHLLSLKARMGSRLSPTQVSVIEVHQQLITLYNKDFFGGRILDSVGLSRPPSQTVDAQITRKMSGFTWAYLVSWERLSDIDADVMFVLPGHFRGAHSDSEQLQTQPLWSKLKVVQTGRVHEVGYYWLGAGSKSANRVLDDLEKYVVKGK